jgi:hypothetical protein
MQRKRMKRADLAGNAAAVLVDEHVAARELGLSVRTLRNWRVNGRGPRFRRLSRRAVRYHRDDLAEYVAALECGGGAR